MRKHRDQYHRYPMNLFEVDRLFPLTLYIYSSPPTPPR